MLSLGAVCRQTHIARKCTQTFSITIVFALCQRLNLVYASLWTYLGEYLWPTLARCPLVARSQSSTLQPTTCLLSIPFPQCDNNHDMPRLHCRGAAASAGTTILSPCRFWRSEYDNRQSTPIVSGDPNTTINPNRNRYSACKIITVAECHEPNEGYLYNHIWQYLHVTYGWSMLNHVKPNFSPYSIKSSSSPCSTSNQLLVHDLQIFWKNGGVFYWESHGIRQVSVASLWALHAPLVA